MGGMMEPTGAEHELVTLGLGRPFVYRGSLEHGLVLCYGSRQREVSAGFLAALRRRHAGRAVPAGLHGGAPPAGGLGWWVRSASRRLNTQPLTVSDASRLAAILVAEGWAEAIQRDRALYLLFAGQPEAPLEEPLPVDDGVRG